MRRRKTRTWQDIIEDDPGSGLLNLVDVWLVFAVALLLALVSHFSLPELVTQRSDVTIIKNPNVYTPNSFCWTFDLPIEFESSRNNELMLTRRIPNMGLNFPDIALQQTVTLRL